MFPCSNEAHHRFFINRRRGLEFAVSGGNILWLLYLLCNQLGLSTRSKSQTSPTIHLFISYAIMSNVMLNRRCDSWYPCLVSVLMGESIQSFIIKYDVSYRLFIMPYNRLRRLTFIPNLLRYFIMHAELSQMLFNMVNFTFQILWLFHL